MIRDNTENRQIDVASSHQLIIFEERNQNMKHFGADRVYHFAKERFYWPNMEKDIKLCLVENPGYMQTLLSNTRRRLYERMCKNCMNEACDMAAKNTLNKNIRIKLKET